MMTTQNVAARLHFPKLTLLPKRRLHKTVPESLKAVQEITIPVPWGHIAGKWWGRTDVQPLIGLHGLEDNCGTFDTLAPLLKVDSFFSFDWPGHGYSSYLPEGRPYTILDHILTLRRVVKHFKWEENLSLLGHSLGSTVIFFYAGMYQGTVENYISIDCARTLMAPDEEVEVMQMRYISDTFLDLEKKLRTNKPPSYTYDQIIDMYLDGSLNSPTKESCKILMKRGLVESEPGKYYFVRDPRLRYHLMARFPYELIINYACNIRCNHLSIRGLQGFIWEGEKEEVYLRSVQNIKKSYYKFEHHDVEGTHHVHLNNPERIAPLVNKFMGLD